MSDTEVICITVIVVVGLVLLGKLCLVSMREGRIGESGPLPPIKPPPLYGDGSGSTCTETKYTISSNRPLSTEEVNSLMKTMADGAKKPEVRV